MHGLLAFATLLALTVPSPVESIKPPALKKGDLIGFAAPAGPLSSRDVARAKAQLESEGYRVTVAYSPEEKRGYLAGEDSSRAIRLNELIRRRELHLIFHDNWGCRNLCYRLLFCVWR